MDNEKLVEFFREVMKLKKVKRSGWVVSGVKDAESVSDHSFMTILMVLILGKEKKMDLNKALKMAILHDIAECRIGDIITWENFHMTKNGKKEIEEDAMKNLLSILGDRGKEYFGIWKEYEKRKSKEAKFVKAIDNLEMVLQALEYEKEEKDLNKYIKTFFEGEDVKLIVDTDKDLSDLVKFIISLRKK
jgi:putative hydrolase of HD superfamily